jgi:hypothetical protein
MNLILPLHNIKLIDFSYIIRKCVETPLLNDLESYGLILDGKVNIKNKDVKRLIYHHVIYELCEHVLSIRGKERIMIHYCNIIPPTKQLNSFVTTLECQIFFNTFVGKIKKMLPIKIMPIDQSFSSIRRDIKNGNGESREAITQAQYIIDKFDIGRYTFTKARYFAKKYGLNYLSNNYFQKIRSKQLIMS